MMTALSSIVATAAATEIASHRQGIHRRKRISDVVPHPRRLREPGKRLGSRGPKPK